MAKSRTTRASKLVVTLDGQSKALIARAAALRRISVTEYIREVAVFQARREVIADKGQTIRMTAGEQFALWTAINAPVKLTSMQRQLGKMMKGVTPPACREQ